MQIALKFSFAALILAVLLQTGCSITHMGPPPLREGRAGVPLDLNREKAIEKYGVPDQVHVVGERSYWVYRRLDGTFINLLNYLSFGSVDRKAIQLEYEGDRLVRVEEYRAGDALSLGILGYAPPGMISE
jgi:hypothetical protein